MKKSVICFLFLVAALPLAGAENLFERVVGRERIEYRGTEYFNYELLLRQADAPSLPSVSIRDVLLEPSADKEFTLHPDLLENMYAEGMRQVFFVVELQPYYPLQKYDPIPWRGREDYLFFGNAFWNRDTQIRSVYRDVYRSYGTDFNEQLRRVERYREMREAPRVFVFARIERARATSQWRNAWGWEHYYYFSGSDIYRP